MGRVRRYFQIEAGRLRLPPSRLSGADPAKLARQISQYSDRIEGMPPVQVTLGAAGEMMINDGVTRAVRIAKLRPGATITVEVIEQRQEWNLHHLPLVKERL